MSMKTTMQCACFFGAKKLPTSMLPTSLCPVFYRGIALGGLIDEQDEYID